MITASIIVLFLACTYFIPSAEGATISVRRDGSGDFATIQPALDAAAVGDTIDIGPGEFTEYQSIRLPGWAWDIETFAYVQVDSLTLVGAGQDQTIIGYREPLIDPDRYSPIAISMENDISSMTVEELTVRNSYAGISIYTASLTSRACRYDHIRIGIFAEAVSVDIENCDFLGDDYAHPYGVYIVQGPVSAVLRGCSFDRAQLSMSGQVDAEVDRCTFSNISVGMKLYNDSQGVVTDCDFRSIGSVGLSVKYDSSCEVSNCTFSECLIGCRFESGAQVVADSLAFEEIEFASVDMYRPALITLNNSQIDPNAEYTVRCIPSGPPTYHHDFTNNFWGVADSASIAETIFDGNDDPNCYDFIDFEPFLDAPTDVNGQDLPREMELGVYPNPFNPRVKIDFRVTRYSDVHLAVFDLRGRLVSLLAAGPFAAGSHTATWDGTDTHGRPVPSGRYFARLEAGGEVVTRSMTLIR